MQPISAQAKTLAISVTATASTSQALPGIGNQVRVVNEGPNLAAVSIGAGTQTATLPATSAGSATGTSTIILAGEDVVFTIPSTRDTPMDSTGVFPAATPLNISAICRAAGTAILDVQVQEGS